MKYLHTMIRISNIEKSLNFYCKGLGLKETRRKENEKGRYTLIFLAAPNDESAEIELTYNWDGDNLGTGSRNFGHLAYRVENIYETCQRLKDMGVTINRPPPDVHQCKTSIFGPANEKLGANANTIRAINIFFIFPSLFILLLVN